MYFKDEAAHLFDGLVPQDGAAAGDGDFGILRSCPWLVIVSDRAGVCRSGFRRHQVRIA